MGELEARAAAQQRAAEGVMGAADGEAMVDLPPPPQSPPPQ